MAGLLFVAASGAVSSKRVRVKTSSAYLALVDAIGGENTDSNQRVYLGRISRVLPGSAAAPVYRALATLSKAELIMIIRDNFDDPVATGVSGGRPRKRDGSPIDLLVVVQEKLLDTGVVDLKLRKVPLGFRSRGPAPLPHNHRGVLS